MWSFSCTILTAIALAMSQHASAEPPRKLSIHKKYVKAISLSPNGKYLATASNDRVVVTSTDSLEEVHVLKQWKGDFADQSVYSICFSPDNNLLALGVIERNAKSMLTIGMIEIYDAKKGQLVNSIKVGNVAAPFRSIIFNNDGGRIFYGAAAANVDSKNKGIPAIGAGGCNSLLLTSQESQELFTMPHAPVGDISLAKDGTLIAVCSDYTYNTSKSDAAGALGVAVCYNTITHKKAGTREWKDSIMMSGLAMDSSTCYIAGGVPSYDDGTTKHEGHGKIERWNIVKSTSSNMNDSISALVFDIAIDSSEKYLLSAGGDYRLNMGEMIVWRTGDGKMLARFYKEFTDPVTSICIDSDTNKAYAISGTDVYIYELGKFMK